MKDEIKEILDRLERIDHKEYIAFEFADSATFDETARCFEERKKMADYITDLQDKIKQYEDPEDLTLFYMWLDEKAKDKMKQLQEEKEKYKHKFWEEQEQNEYLQDKIKELEQINEEHRELNGKLREENEGFKEYAKTYLKSKINRKNKELELVKTKLIEEHNKCYDYKTRNEKAIEFVESMEYCGQEDYFYDEKAMDPCGNDNTFEQSKTKLLNILQGKSDE